MLFRLVGECEAKGRKENRKKTSPTVEVKSSAGKTDRYKVKYGESMEVKLLFLFVESCGGLGRKAKHRKLIQ